MDGLFLGPWSDLGPTRLYPDRTLLPIAQIGAPRGAALRGQLQPLCPAKPGVYAMLNREGSLLYVGKAKNLRTRLLSYFRAKSRAPKAGRIVRQARTILWETWPSEFAALLRELELIRHWRPSWNVQGQPFRRQLTFICLGRGPAPYLYLSNKPAKKTLSVFGPVPRNKNADLAVRRVNDLFRLRDCPEPQEMRFAEELELFPQEAPTAGCVRLDLGTCLGPCVRECDTVDYYAQVRAAVAFLAGTNDEPLTLLEKEMHEASSRLEFEKAAGLRDRLNALRWVDQKLRQLRRAREEMSWIYPVAAADGSSWWYLIHGGRVLAVVDPSQVDFATQKIQNVYFGKDWEALLDSHEHVDGRLLVDLWFRKYPKERKKVMQPKEALERLQSLSEK